MFWRFGDAPKAIWSDAQRGLGASGARREQFGAMPSEVWALRERFGSNLERCPARFLRFGSALEAIWSDAQRGFGVSGAHREQFGAMPSEVLAFRERLEKQFGAMPSDVFASLLYTESNSKRDETGVVAPNGDSSDFLNKNEPLWARF